VSEIRETKVSGKGVIIALGIICIILASGLVATVALNSQIGSLNSQITNLKNQITKLQTQTNDDLRNATNFIVYYEEFGNASLLNPSYTFIPPISMYRALISSLKSGG
jgi:predicted PurR-regulated permease PerM